MSTEVKSGGSLAWAIMARSLFSRIGTACLLYLDVINVIYLVPNKAVKKTTKKQHFMTFFMTWKTYRRTKIYNKRDINPF
jgi:hypothetical protein